MEWFVLTLSLIIHNKCCCDLARRASDFGSTFKNTFCIGNLTIAWERIWNIDFLIIVVVVVPDFSGHFKTWHCKFVAKDFIFIFDKKETVRLSQRMGSISPTTASHYYKLAKAFSKICHLLFFLFTVVLYALRLSSFFFRTAKLLWIVLFFQSKWIVWLEEKRWGTTASNEIN